jgi:hypothetical protein
MTLNVIRDPEVLFVTSRAPRVEARPPTPNMEDFLLNPLTPALAKAKQEARADAIAAGVTGQLGHKEGERPPPVIASEVLWEHKAEALRRAQADSAALAGGDRAGPGYRSAAFARVKAQEKEASLRAFGLDPVKEHARFTVRKLALAAKDLNADSDYPLPEGYSDDGPPLKEGGDVTGLIHELIKGQRELRRLRQERPPMALEPRGDARPIASKEKEQADLEEELKRLRAHRLKLGLDENDLTRPPEKWIEAMLSYVAFNPYGPPKEEDDAWEKLEDLGVLTDMMRKVVNDPAAARQLQQWVDGKSRVYKFFLARALEATEDRAPVNLLRQALNNALGDFRPVDDDLRIAAMGAEEAAAFKSKTQGRTAVVKKRAKAPAGGEGGGEGGAGDAHSEGRPSEGGSSESGQPGDGDGGMGATQTNRMAALRALEEKLSKGRPIADGEFDDNEDDGGA